MGRLVVILIHVFVGLVVVILLGFRDGDPEIRRQGRRGKIFAIMFFSMCSLITIAMFPNLLESMQDTDEVIAEIAEPHFSVPSFVLGGFCMSAILAAIGFAVVHTDKKHEEKQNEEEKEKK